jgi:phosphomannomutase
MSEVSRFYGIIVRMYWGDHPPPHFHARYGSEEVQVRIDPVGLLRGHLPPRILAMVVQWAALHREELLADWYLAQGGQCLNPIEGLP